MGTVTKLPAAAPAEATAPATAAASTDLATLKPDATAFVLPGDEDHAETTIYIGKFCFLKSLLLVEQLGELATKVDFASIMSQREFVDDTGKQRSQIVLHTDRIADLLPPLMRTMRPTLMRALAIAVAKNKDLEAADREQGSFEPLLKNLEYDVAYRLDLEKAAELLVVAIDKIGVQHLKRHFPTLLAALKG